MTETEVPDPDRAEDELEEEEEKEPLRRAADNSEVPEADAQEQARAAWNEDDDDYR